MSKRKLTDVVQVQPKKTALDLAEETLDAPRPKPAQKRTAKSTGPIPRTTDRISISLLSEERTALEDKAVEFRRKGRRDLKTSRLARIAFRLLLEAKDEEVFRIADEVPNLEQLRVKQR